jgi:SnoaL-like polyketide cyclase
VASCSWWGDSSEKTRGGNEEKQEVVGMSAEEKNKAVVRRFNEEFYNRGNIDVAYDLLAPDYVDHDLLPGEQATIEDYKREIDEQHVSSDLHFSIE